MICVTGAAGKTGRAIVAALAARGQDVRAAVFREEQRAELHALGARETVTVEMLEPAQLQAAFDGVAKIYHIGPNMHPHEQKIGENVIRAAGAAGCQHFVYHSVLYPHTEGMPHHWCKLRVEEQLLQSRLPFTVLQPAAYLQNLLANWNDISTRGVYAVPYSAQTRVSLVDLADIAKVAAKVLTEAGHEQATYALSSADAPTQTEIAETFANLLERQVRIETVTRERWSTDARASGLGAYAVETLIKMFRHYECYDFIGSSRTLKWLLGREPTSLEEFILRTLARASPGS